MVLRFIHYCTYYSSLFLSIILLYKYITIYLFFYGWTLSYFWFRKLWIWLLWTALYILFSKYRGVKFKGRQLDVCLALLKTAQRFSKVVAPSHIPPAIEEQPCLQQQRYTYLFTYLIVQLYYIKMFYSMK